MSTQFFIGVVCLTFVHAALIPEFDGGECLPGPLKIYEILGCVPLFRKSELGCPHRFNCSHLKRRSPEKCYHDGKVYSIGEKLESEYTDSPCTSCVCDRNEGPAQFQCLVNCCFPKVKKGCYLQRNATQCCPGPQKCPEDPEDVPICKVGDQIYRDGEYFKPLDEPKKDCYCGPNYKGKNIEPFCFTPNLIDCDIELHRGREILQGCAPVYEPGKLPETDCTMDFRCQTPKDVIVIPQRLTSNQLRGKCVFGSLKLRVGQRLDRLSYYLSTRQCMDCTCHIPPYLTCNILPDDLCSDNADVLLP